MLYVVRHGRTSANASRRLQGRLDLPLDEVGRQQAVLPEERHARADVGEHALHLLGTAQRAMQLESLRRGHRLEADDGRGVHHHLAEAPRTEGRHRQIGRAHV